MALSMVFWSAARLEDGCFFCFDGLISDVIVVVRYLQSNILPLASRLA